MEKDLLAVKSLNGLNFLKKTIFQVISIETKVNPNSTLQMIHYADNKDEICKCWGPKHFVDQIRRRRSTTQRPYFVSHGLVVSGTKKVAYFEISYQNVNKEFDIFDHETSEIHS